MTIGTHYFSLTSCTPQKIRSMGSRTDVNKDVFPILLGMSLSLLRLQPKAIREPHWHPNSGELSYCLSGRALMTIFGTDSSHNTFTIDPGELVFVPQGNMHHIENIGDGELTMLLCFHNERSEDLDMSSSIYAMPAHVMAEALKVGDSLFADCKKAGDSVFIAAQEKELSSNTSFLANSHKMNLEQSRLKIETLGGVVKLSNADLIPPLKNLACYSLLLYKKGIREPHWHPNSHELNYVVRGKVQITVLSPKDKVDTFVLNAGDISFIPRGYFHHIENIGDGEMKMLVFFNNEYPSDIGITGALGAYPNALLSSIFSESASYFDKMPKFQEDQFVVSGGG